MRSRETDSRRVIGHLGAYQFLEEQRDFNPQGVDPHYARLTAPCLRTSGRLWLVSQIPLIPDAILHDVSFLRPCLPSCIVTSRRTGLGGLDEELKFWDFRFRKCYFPLFTLGTRVSTLTKSGPSSDIPRFLYPLFFSSFLFENNADIKYHLVNLFWSDLSRDFSRNWCSLFGEWIFQCETFQGPEGASSTRIQTNRWKSVTSFLALAKGLAGRHASRRIRCQF